MTNPMFNPQPNYSGVTIQISNPAVYTGQFDGKSTPVVNGGYCGVNQNCIPNNQAYINYPQPCYTQSVTNPIDSNQHERSGLSQQNGLDNPNKNTGYPNAYPPQYYLNNYNYGVNGDGNNINDPNRQQENNIQKNNSEDNQSTNDSSVNNNGLANNNVDNEKENNSNSSSSVTNPNSYKIYADKKEANNNDMTKSQNIIDDLSNREAEVQEEKKNTKETKIVALTDEYIKSLENYLNNQNDEIRLMASKEILTRLDEDKDRYDDAALNALLNKMLQDPNKIVRIAALSAFSSQLACGNDYTVQLLQNIQSNPNADKEDILQAADILLKMSAGVEVKNIPNPSVKDNKEQ